MHDAGIDARVAENFRKWRGLHGFREPFPELQDIPESLLESVMVRDDEMIDRVYDAIGQPMFAVTVKPGQGCTTLHNYLLRRARVEAIGRRLIPLAVDVGNLARRGNEDEHSLASQIRIGLLRELIRPESQWDKKLQRERKRDWAWTRRPGYLEMINGWGHGDDLEVYRGALLGQLTTNWREALRQVPEFQRPVPQLLARLADLMTVKLLLFFDFSTEMTPDERYDLWGFIKDFFDDANRASTENGVARISETTSVVAFLTPLDVDTLTKFLPRPTDTFPYPPYTWSEILRMVARHHPPSGLLGDDPGVAPLAALIDDNLMRAAYAPDKPLKDTVAAFKKLLLQALDCEPAQLPFKLTRSSG